MSEYDNIDFSFEDVACCDWPQCVHHAVTTVRAENTKTRMYCYAKSCGEHISDHMKQMAEQLNKQ